jgi:hypothetical protein
VRQTDSVDAKGKALRHVSTVHSHFKIQPELISHGHQFARGRENRSLGIAHFYSKFSAILLGGSWKNEDAHHPQKADDSFDGTAGHFVKSLENLNATDAVLGCSAELSPVVRISQTPAQRR